MSPQDAGLPENGLSDRERETLAPARAFLARLREAGGDAAPASEPDPDTLFARLQPHLHALGITRVGDSTGLDTLEIPVWFATRPNARALSVSQGKGLTHAQASLSATMEAIEGAVAERPETLVTREARWGEMRRDGLALPMAGLMRCLEPAFPDDRMQAWVPGLSLRSGRPVFAPYELIGLDLRSHRPGERPWDRVAFRMSSIGLGAGGDLARAALQALLELVENAATAPLEMFGLLPSLARPVRASPGAHPGLDAALARIAAAGLEARFVDLTDRIGLPIVGAFIERTILDDKTGGGARACAGFACRLDPLEAALAALLEAAQSRLTDIAGARDDIEPDDYAAGALTLPPASAQAPELGTIGRAPRQGSRAAQFRVALDAVFAGGAPDAFLFPLPFPAGTVQDVHVVRMLVPGLEAATDGLMQLGAGALDRLLDRLPGVAP